MDLPSNICIACSCRSTRPFQTFLVSNIGQPWLGSAKHVPVPEPQYSTLIIPSQNGNRDELSSHRGIMHSPAHAYLPRVWVKCGTSWRLVPQSTRSLTGCFTIHAFQVVQLPAPLLDYPLLVIYMSFLFSQPKGIMKTPYYPRGKLRLLERLPPVSYLSTLTLPIPSPVYGIISRCSMYRIQVASDSAGNLSSSRLLLEFIWSVSEIQQSIERN